MVIQTTLCYLIKDGKILLQKKAKGLFGEGKWNGPGGKLKEGETPEDCAKREVLEEVSTEVSNIKKCGHLTFFKDKEEFLISNIFIINDFKGDPKSGKEGIVQWFDFNELPFEKMWPDDKHWMPVMLQEKNFEGNFYFDDKLEKLLHHELKVI